MALDISTGRNPLTQVEMGVRVSLFGHQQTVQSPTCDAGSVTGIFKPL